ncbi:MAG TPA: hypothetical protein PKE26_15060 [Kiritimatiellia bacterium]|nr:hypothetical protein [Kiritimatiellia bacterium]HMP00416.1 hypothetical protein [Kiritimatiellia bacterium]
MVQKLNRLIGRADFRVLVFAAILTVLVTIGWTFAQLADDSNTVDTLQDVAELFLELRENSYQLAVPSWYMHGDELEAIEETYGLAGFAQQPDWFVAFSGELFFSAKSDIGQQVEHGTKLIVYEDMLTGELLMVREDTGKEEIVFKAPEWPEVAKGEPYKKYLYRELSKRRVVWRVTLKEINQAEEEYAAMLAAMEEDEGEGGQMMLLMGGADELAIAGMYIFTNGLLLNLEYTASFSGTVWSAYSYDAPACLSTNEGGSGGGGGSPPLPGTNECTNCVSSCESDPAKTFNGLVPAWTLVYTNIVLTGETFTAWTDTRPLAQDLYGNPAHRFYAFGRSDIDTDEDGLNDSFEIFVSKGNPELWDTDGDGVNDADEWNYGTNPNDPNDPPNVKGIVAYSGQQTNDIVVLATPDSDGWSTAYSTSISTTGNYHITYIPSGTYHIKAFRDVNGNGFRDQEEAIGVYSNNPISVTGQIIGINITLTEPDTDGDGISDYAERTIFRTNPNNASDIPPQLTRASVQCYYGHASGSTNWQLKEGSSGLIKSFNVGRGWVTNGMFLPDLAIAPSPIYFGEAIGTTTNNKGGWIYGTTITLDSNVDMGKGWVWDKGFLTDYREASRQVNYFRPKANAYPDLFVFTHSTKPQSDYLGFGWVRPGSFVADLNTSYGDIHGGLVYDFWTSTNMTRTHTLPASRTSIHKKGRLGFGWATAAGFVPSTHSFSYYYYGQLKDSRGVSGYSTSSLDFNFGTYMTLGFGYLAGGDFIPLPGAGDPPIGAYDQDGDGFIDIPMASDTQFAILDDGDFLQLPVTIGDASGSHTEMYGFDIGSFKYDMPFVNANEYLFTSVVPLQRGLTYSGSLRSLPDGDDDGDYTFLLGGYIQGPSTNLVYVSAEQLGVVVQANFPHSGSQNTNIFGYVNDSGFNSGSKSFTLHVPRVNIRAHRAGLLNSPGTEVTRFHEHLPYAVLLPPRNQSAPATLTTNDGLVSTLKIDRFLPAGITSGFLRVSINNTNVLALYDHNNNRIPNNLLYNVATISVTNPLYQLKSAARTWHALGLTNGTASVTLSYGLTTNSVLCTDTIQFGVVDITVTQVVSDQIPGTSVNKLPTDDSNNIPMIVGNRKDNKTHLLINSYISPSSATGFVYIGVRKVGTTNLLATSKPAINAPTPLVFESESRELYEIVAGLDRNRDGTLGDGEVSNVFTNHIRTITNGAYEGDRYYLWTGVLGTWMANPTAASLLTAFLLKSTPVHFTANNTLISANELTHPIGEFWGSSGTTTGKVYSRANLTEVLFASDFRSAILNDAATNHIGDIQGYFQTYTNATEGWFGPWSFSFPSFAFESNFFFVDADLYYAFHGVNGMQGQYSLRVRSDYTVAEMCISNGSFSDIYDFNYNDGGLSQSGATVQAGYGTLGGAGRVFKLNINFSGCIFNP